MDNVKNYNLEEVAVLIVEDNPHMRNLMTQMIRGMRVADVRTAEDGAAALREMKTFSPDLVFCDWEMSPIDGLEFTRMVRTAEDSSNPFVPIVLVTGHTEAQRVAEARDAGITEFLAKPVSIKLLYERICWVIDHPRQFVQTGDFKGPDRRRVKDKVKSQLGRRAKDANNAEDD